MLKISFKNENIVSSAIAVIINDQLKLDQETLYIDQQHHGIISKTINDKNLFETKSGYSKVLTTTNKEGHLVNLILVSIGSENDIMEVKIEEAGGRIHNVASLCKASTVFVNAGKIGKFESDEVASLLASGALLASYRFDKYFTKKSLKEKFVTEEFIIKTNNIEQALKKFENRKAVAMGVFFARDCISEVPNVLYPESYAERIVQKLEPLGIDVNVLGEAQMRQLGMNALLGVGQGSANESKLVVMRYNGAQGGEAENDLIGLVGKGVTFDTGGISLKPALNMHDMKYDMAGSAAVVGTIKALALRGAKVNVVAVVGLVENMPGGGAQRPGDVVTTMSGQTVEVLNTDAEGRLVLGDCMTYLQENFKPTYIIDLATLTGAISVALGSTYAGCFANNKDLANRLINSSLAVNEKLWHMPLHADYNEMINSTVADIANIGSERGLAGSSTAAQFLNRFVKEGVKWAHLDIAGVAWDRKGLNPLCTRGAVGFGVRVLNQLVKDNYESK